MDHDNFSIYGKQIACFAEQNGKAAAGRRVKFNQGHVLSSKDLGLTPASFHFNFPRIRKMTGKTPFVSLSPFLNVLKNYLTQNSQNMHLRAPKQKQKKLYKYNSNASLHMGPNCTLTQI